jgi:hypothetical protein
MVYLTLKKAMAQCQSDGDEEPVPVAEKEEEVLAPVDRFLFGEVLLGG